MAEVGEATGSRLVYADYGSIITGDEPSWRYASFPLPDGSVWHCREPETVVVVEGQRLRAGVVPFTQRHDRIQILDNAKNMWFSTRLFRPPDRGTITVEWEMSARGIETRPGDLYDGFVSVNLLDFAHGLALDVFCSDDRIATVYARLPFPGTGPFEDPNPERPKYFCHFHELDLPTTSGQLHRCRIAYTKAADEVVFWVDGHEVSRYREVPARIDAFLIALGLMTEKPIERGTSVSAHGQGVVGEWGPFTVTGDADSSDEHAKLDPGDVPARG